MALWGENKRDIFVAEHAAMRKENEFLKLQVQDKADQIKVLQDSVSRLQSALIAKESPEAYIDQRNIELEAKMTSSEEFQRMDREQKIYRAYAFEQEKSMFSSPEELIATLSQALPMPESRSLHGDNES